MWQQKIIYEGNSDGIFTYDAFQQLMKDRGLRIPYEDLPAYKKVIYVLEPATVLVYAAKKRIVPRGLDLWHTVITLSGYGVEEVEKNLQEIISEQKS